MASQHTILVPVTHNPASIEAVTVACQLARQRKSKVLAVHVIEVLRSLPLNAEMEVEARRGEQLLRKAEEAAAHAGLHISGQLVQAREAGQAIVDEARDQNADVIVMGIGYKRLIGAFPARNDSGSQFGGAPFGSSRLTTSKPNCSKNLARSGCP